MRCLGGHFAVLPAFKQSIEKSLYKAENIRAKVLQSNSWPEEMKHIKMRCHEWRNSVPVIADLLCTSQP